MRSVVDTNVWVSAFLTPDGTAAKLLAAMYARQLIPMYSAAIELEYRSVLYRPKFNIEPQVLNDFFDGLRTLGQYEDHISPLNIALPDATDAPFIGLALYAGCSVVTGNTKHFPLDAGVVVLTPAEWVARRST